MKSKQLQKTLISKLEEHLHSQKNIYIYYGKLTRFGIDHHLPVSSSIDIYLLNMAETIICLYCIFLFQIIKNELFRNLALASVAVFLVTLFLVANLWMSIMIFACVVLSMVS